MGKQIKQPMVVRKLDSGERFIETRKADYVQAVNNWLAGKTDICPIIAGHYMFKTPKEYGCEVIPFSEAVSVSADIFRS